jgi:hypothetical protein
MPRDESFLCPKARTFHESAEIGHDPHTSAALIGSCLGGCERLQLNIPLPRESVYHAFSNRLREQ